MAKLYYRYGAMGSSKTANAIMVQYNYHERGQKVLMMDLILLVVTSSSESGFISLPGVIMLNWLA